MASRLGTAPTTSPASSDSTASSRLSGYTAFLRRTKCAPMSSTGSEAQCCSNSACDSATFSINSAPSWPTRRICAAPDGGPISAAQLHAGAARQCGCVSAALAADGRVLLWRVSPADVLYPEGGARAATPTAAVRPGPRERERTPTSPCFAAIEEEVEPVAEVLDNHAAAVAADPTLSVGLPAPAVNAVQVGRPDACCSGGGTGERTRS